MFSLDRDKDTICALSTAPGVGAIAVVRVSGENVLEIVSKIAPFLPQQPESHRVYYGHLVSPEDKQNMDEVLLTFFAKGRSFTGESCIEISCHGSSAITQHILRALIACGARMAQRGEFTYRAFSNGRIDLVQAESILSLIESQSEQASLMALRHLKGELSFRISQIEEDFLWALSRLEANIDFASEDIEFATQNEILARCDRALKNTQNLLNSYKRGRVLKKGLRVVLVGEPNVGKSSLLNSLSKQDRAIVSPQAGTTRDLVEIQINLEGQPVTLVDTAGLRETTDEIESLGVAKTYEAISDSDVVLFVYDCTEPNTRLRRSAVYDHAKDRRFITLANKSDRLSNPPNNLVQTESQQEGLTDSDIYVSAQTGEGIEKIYKALSRILLQHDEAESLVVINGRQYDLLSKMVHSALSGRSLVAAKASPELAISEIQLALNYCMELLGRTFDDQVLDRVFNDFCLGK